MTHPETLRLIFTVPLFHAAGLCMFINAMCWDHSFAFGMERPLSSDLVGESLNNVDADATMLPPAILEHMSQSDSCVRALQKLKFVIYGGGMSTRPFPQVRMLTSLVPGKLSQKAGNTLVRQGVKLVNNIAATEHVMRNYLSGARC